MYISSFCWLSPITQQKLLLTVLLMIIIILPLWYFQQLSISLIIMIIRHLLLPTLPHHDFLVHLSYLFILPEEVLPGVSIQHACQHLCFQALDNFELLHLTNIKFKVEQEIVIMVVILHSI